MTGAGLLALGAAETMAAVVLGYAVREDAVLAMDITPSYADMHSGQYKYCGPDRCNLLMARVQLLAEYYGCPTGVHGGKTDSCFYNEQTGIEKISSMLLTVMAGAVGIGTVGHLENAVTFSPVQLVIDNELVRYVRRALRSPWTVDSQTLAAEVVDAVGPGGHFLAQDHTAAHFRQELFFSRLFPVTRWAEAHDHPDRFDATRQAEALARDLWRRPEAPVLADDQLRAIDALVARAEKDLAAGG